MKAHLKDNAEPIWEISICSINVCGLKSKINYPEFVEFIKNILHNWCTRKQNGWHW